MRSTGSRVHETLHGSLPATRERYGFVRRGLCLSCSLFLLLLASGCAGNAGDDGTPSCTPATDIGHGEMRATVDGDDWFATGGVYQLQPVGLLVNVAVDAGNSMNMLLSQVAEFSVDDEGDLDVEVGAEVEDVLSEENLPLDFKLGRTSSDGGSVTLYVDDETHQSNEASEDGFARITAIGDDVITGCFRFSAGPAQGSGDDVLVEDGSFSVPSL